MTKGINLKHVDNKLQKIQMQNNCIWRIEQNYKLTYWRNGKGKI